MINTLKILNYKNTPCIYVVIRTINGFIEVFWGYKCGTTTLHPNKKTKYSGLHNRISDFRTMEGADGTIGVLYAWGWDELKYGVSGLEVESYWHELMSEFHEKKEFFGKGITEKQIINFAEKALKDFDIKDVVRVHETQKINNKISNIKIGKIMNRKVNPFDVAVGCQQLKDNNMEMYQRARDWAGGITSTTRTTTPVHEQSLMRAHERAEIILDKAKVASDSTKLISLTEFAKEYFPTMAHPDYSTTIGGNPGKVLANGAKVYRSDTLNITEMKADKDGDRKAFMSNIFIDKDTAKQILDTKSTKG